jgi:flagellar hook-associated protein 2
MSTTTLGPTYDPTSTATALAQKYTAPSQDALTAQTTNAGAVQKALSTLSSAIMSFQTSLASLTGLNKAMFAQLATLSNPAIGSASASSTAAAGSYNFFVEQVATTSQVSYNNLADNGVGGGSLDIRLAGATTTTPTVLTIDLSAADTDNNGVMTVRELAAAINKSSANNGRVSAAVVTVNGVQQLMLSSANTGVDNTIALDTTNMVASGMKTALADPTNFSEIAKAQDAIAWIGGYSTGTRIQQASNTFSNIDGVKVTFTKAQAIGDTPVTVTVAPDSSTTNKNVQAFIDAYNKLKTAVGALADPGDPNNKVAAGTFAHDAGIRALRDRLADLVRPTGSASLAAFGIIGAKDGTLTLDTARLASQLAKDPNGLDTLIGSTAISTRGGIADKLDTFLDQWSDTATGQLKQRGDQLSKLQKDLATRQTALDAQYDAAYQRYLMQFTQLQALQSQMSSNSSMFDALFGNSKSN